MSYASVVPWGNKGKFKPCIVINDGKTSRLFVLLEAKPTTEEKAMSQAITVYGLLKRQIEEFMRKRKFEEKM